MNNKIVTLSFVLMSILIFLGLGTVIVNAQPLIDELQKAKIIVTSHKYIKNNDSSFDHLVGQVKNVGNGSAKSVKLIFTYYDSNGDVIGTDDLYIDAEKLNPGQKAPFSELRDKSNRSEMAYYEIALKWDNPDGSEKYVENAQILKEKYISNNEQVSSDFSLKTLDNSKNQLLQNNISSINKSMTDKDVKNWLEYTNPIYDFSLEYPEDWQVIEGNRFKNIPGLIIPTSINTSTDIHSIFNDYGNYNNGMVIFGQIPIPAKASIKSTDMNEKIYENMIEKFSQNNENSFSNWQIFEIIPNKTVNHNDAISAIFLIGDPIKDKFSLILESLFFISKNKIYYFTFIGNPDTFDQSNVSENRKHILNSIKLSNDKRVQLSSSDMSFGKEEKEFLSQEENIVLKIQEGAATQGNPNYDPKVLMVNKGDTIVVDNVDDMPHTVTNGEGPLDSNSGKIFDSSIINNGESGKIYTANIDFGSYKYYCSVHPYMTGTLIIE